MVLTRSAKRYRPTTTVKTNRVPSLHKEFWRDTSLAKCSAWVLCFGLSPQGGHARCVLRIEIPKISLYMSATYGRGGKLQSPYTFSSNKSLKNHLHHRQRGERARRLETGNNCAGIEKKKWKRRLGTAAVGLLGTLDVAFSSLFFKNFKKKLADGRPGRVKWLGKNFAVRKPGKKCDVEKDWKCSWSWAHKRLFLHKGLAQIEKVT